MTFEIYLLFKCRACGTSIPVKLNDEQATKFVNENNLDGQWDVATEYYKLGVTPPMHGCPVSRTLVNGQPVEVEWRGLTDLVGYSIPRYYPEKRPAQRVPPEVTPEDGGRHNLVDGIIKGH